MKLKRCFYKSVQLYMGESNDTGRHFILERKGEIVYLNIPASNR